ncbi:oligosaccharide flippase family protein [Paraglaciecola sp.]|uniref:oligosaccharide flippase family protein n=1 Tax=Paraglaciecola sp. TaxID=1920173 RepID=UPI003265C68C
MSFSSKILKGSAWSLIGNATYQLSGLLIFILLSRMLAPVDFGTAALAIVFVELTNIIVKYGLVQVIVRSSKQDNSEIENNVFNTTLLIGLFTTILFLVLGPYIELLFEAPGLSISLQILSVVPLMQALATTPEGILHRDFKFKPLALMLLLSSILAGTIAIFCAYNNFGFYSLIIQKVISTVLYLILVWRTISWRPHIRITYSEVIQTLKQGNPIVTSALIGQGTLRFVELIVGYFLGVVALGYLKIANKLLNTIVQFTIKPIVDVSLPAFATLKNDLYKLNECYLNFISICLTFAIPTFVGGYVIGADLTDLVFGSNWLPSGHLLSILCLGGMSATLNYFFGPICHATNNSHIPLKIRIFELIAVVIVISVSAQYSIEYVVYSTVLISTAITFVMFIVLRQVFSFSIRQIALKLCPPVICSILMGFSINQYQTLLTPEFSTTLKVLSCGFLGGILYFLFYQLVFPQKLKELILKVKTIKNQ